MKVKFNNSNCFIKKILAITVSAVIVLNILPFFTEFKALASEENFYDNSLGNYYEEKGVLIAKPYENSAFRGWYNKVGEEVSCDASFPIPSGKTAEDYIPVFYNLNILENAGFEDYSAEALESWNSVSGNSEFEISGKVARSGGKSLEITTNDSDFYYNIENLETNIQYSITFYYKGQSNLKTVTVVSTSDTLNNSANLYAGKFIARCSQNELENDFVANEWNKVSINFITYENTSVKLAMLYEGENLFIDDMALVRGVMSAPTYLNNEFENYNSKAGADNAYLNFSHTKPAYTKAVITEDARLKVTSTRNTNVMSSEGILFKKGAKYTFNTKLDISEFQYRYVPKLDSNGNQVLDSNGNLLYEQVTSNGQPVDMVNWINFSFSTKRGTFGSTADDSFITSNSVDVPITMVVTNKSGTVLFKKDSRYSGLGFGIESVKNVDDRSNLDVTITFVSDKTCVGYFNIRNNANETFYLDSIKLEEDNQTVDIDSVVQKYALKTVGNAIRTEDKQGIRHKTSFDKVLLTADNNYGIRFTEYGTLAIKNEYLGENELVLDGKYDFNGKIYSAKKGVAYSFKDKVDMLFSENESNIDFTAVLINIAKENWNIDYTVRAYFKYLDANGEENIIYMDVDDVAVYPVAKLAYSAVNSSGEYKEPSKVRNYLYNNIISKFADKEIVVKNNTVPIYSNFQGISSTVYHATTFFPDSHGRTYTEEMAAIEMDRLVDTKVNNVRTRFSSQWMWTANGWKWDSEKMQAFYKWAKMLDDRNISITLNLSWSMKDFIYYYDYYKNNNHNNYSTNGHSSIPEVDYLHGVGDDIYGEDAKVNEIKNYPNLNLNESEKKHFSVVAARYSEWGRQALNALKAYGVNNVEYIIPFTETGSFEDSLGDYTFSYDEWLMLTMALHDTLKKEGIRKEYKIIGPCQSIYANQNKKIPFVEYVYSTISGTEFEDLLDINAMHQYTRPNTRAGYTNTVYDPVASYSLAAENFPYYRQVLNKADVADMEFWCDEYFAHANDARWWDGVGMQMTQFAAGLTAGINNGVNRFLTWQMFDTLWDSDATHGTAHTAEGALNNEFIGGVHAVGTCPSLVKANGETCTKASCSCKNYTKYSSYTPRVTYYGINLLGKYLNNKNAQVLATDVSNNDTDFDGGVYVSAIKNDLGKNVILVVNTMPTVSTVNISFEKAVDLDFERYVYNPNEIVSTVEAKSISSDKTISLNGENSFKDVIPAGSFAIYTETIIVGNDTDMDMGLDEE